MNRVAVIGGAGFVGTNLVRRLAQDDFDVVVVDDFSTGLLDNLRNVRCKVIEASICDSKALLTALEDCKYIFHLAARGSVPRSIENPEKTFEVNVGGTLNVLECARKTGGTVAFSSSSSVYGANDLSPKSEKLWTAPLSPYAASKLAGEGLMQSYSESYGLSVITYRFFNIFGPWQRPNHHYAAVIPKWIWLLLNSEKRIDIFGDGSQSRDFTYVDTVVDVLIAGMNKKLCHPGPINVAFGNEVTLTTVIDLLRKDFGEFQIENLNFRIGDVRHSKNDPKLLRDLFPEINPVDFTEGLRKTIDWYKKYGNKVSNYPLDSD